MDANAGAAAAATIDESGLQLQLVRGANWFFWIAALSLVNTAMSVMEADRSFLVGLAVTQMADAIASIGIKDGAPEALRWAAVAFDAVVAGLFVGAGVLARRRRRWAYVAGMVLYVLDGAVCAVLQIWPNLAFHALVLFFLWRGFDALRLMAPPARAPAAAGARPNPLVR
jgi:hypothetical protein